MFWPYVQADNDFAEHRAPVLARLLVDTTRRPVTLAEAVGMQVVLVRRTLGLVEERAEDLAQSFAVATYLPKVEAPGFIADVCGWPRKLGGALVNAFAHPKVRLLEQEEDGWRIADVTSTYLEHARKGQGKRAHDRAAKYVGARGFKHVAGKGWTRDGVQYFDDVEALAMRLKEKADAQQ